MDDKKKDWSDEDSTNRQGDEGKYVENECGDIGGETTGSAGEFVSFDRPIPTEKPVTDGDEQNEWDE